MTILGIVGSKRKKGNTAALVTAALDAAKGDGIETELVYLCDYAFEGCRGCEGCRDTLTCVVKDDMQKLYPKLIHADALILGSPTYFYNITASMKAFLERLYPYEIFDADDRSVWLSQNEVTGIKYAAVIAVCEQEDVQDMGFTADAMSMPLAALGYRVVDVVKALHLFKKNDGANHPDTLAAARNAGLKLAKTLLLQDRIKAKLTLD